MRRGVTLLELTLVLLVMGLGVALVAPAIVDRRPRTPQFVDVVRGARDLAIARAQSLVLTVDMAGDWDLSAGGEGKTSLGRGTVADPPLQVMRVTIAPTGACMLHSSRPGVWDVARCERQGGRS